MKRAFILFVSITFITFYGFSQTKEAFDYISPFDQGLAAVKKGDQWAFIDQDGDLVINFRKDLATTKTAYGEYPVFSNGRCLIKREKNRISYFGYIDTSGKTVINPIFLDATNFSNKLAIVLKVKKEKAGYNNVLGKDVVYYTYTETIIDINGEIKNNLTEAKNVVLNKDFLSKLPKITSKLVSKKLVATLNNEKKWVIKKISK